MPHIENIKRLVAQGKSERAVKRIATDIYGKPRKSGQAPADLGTQLSAKVKRRA